MGLQKFSIACFLAWEHLTGYSNAMGIMYMPKHLGDPGPDSFLRLSRQQGSFNSHLTQNIDIDFNALLDGSLGNMPALWLVSQGIMLELNSTSDSPGPDDSLFRSSNTAVGEWNRTKKEDGAILASFLTSILVPSLTKIQDDGVAVGMCNLLASTALGMANTLLTQEVGGIIYPKNNTADDFEEAVIPGVVFGSVVTNGLNTAISRKICKKLDPKFGAWGKGWGRGATKKVWKSLNRGFKDIMTGHLEGLKVTKARASQFASQLDDTLRLAQRSGLRPAYEHFNREILHNAAQVGRAAAANSATELPALNQLARLGSQSLPNLGVLSVSPVLNGANPINHLQSFLDNHAQVLDVARSVPDLSRVASDLSPAVSNLQNSARDAANALESGLTSQAERVMGSAANAVGGFLDGLISLDPFPGGESGCEAGQNSGNESPEHSNDDPEDGRVETKTVTVTKTKTRTIEVDNGPGGTFTATVTSTRVIGRPYRPAGTVTVDKGTRPPQIVTVAAETVTVHDGSPSTVTKTLFDTKTDTTTVATPITMMATQTLTETYSIVFTQYMPITIYDDGTTPHVITFTVYPTDGSPAYTRTETHYANETPPPGFWGDSEVPPAHGPHAHAPRPFGSDSRPVDPDQAYGASYDPAVGPPAQVTWAETVDVECMDVLNFEHAMWYTENLANKCTNTKIKKVLVRLHNAQRVIDCHVPGYQYGAMDWVVAQYEYQCKGKSHEDWWAHAKPE